MAITDPGTLLEEVDSDRIEILLGGGKRKPAENTVHYVEPAGSGVVAQRETAKQGSQTDQPPVHEETDPATKTIIGKVQTLGDLIDTDALAPAEALMAGTDRLGEFCLIHTHPDFRRRVKEDGLNVVVAGAAFGVGSSRDGAVTALQLAGVQCVIARSFAFIFARNQLNLGLLGIVMNDEEFYTLAQDGAEIELHVDSKIIKVGGREFAFELAQLEERMWKQGGMGKAFARLGKGMLESMTESGGEDTYRDMNKSVMMGEGAEETKVGLVR